MTMDSGNNITLSDAYQLFVFQKESEGLSEGTLDFYRVKLSRFREWINVEDASEVRPTDIRKYLVHLKREGYKESTINGDGRALSALFSFAEEDGLIGANPMRGVNLPRVPREVLPDLSREQVVTLLANSCLRNTAIIKILLDTGVRVSELCSLNAEDFDMPTGAVVIKRGKGSKGRTVFIGASTRRSMMRYWISLQSSPEGQEAAFRGIRHWRTRLNRSGVYKSLTRLGEPLGIKPCNPHVFRRTFAVNMLRNGCDLYRLAHLMGHSDIKTLQRYLNIDMEDLRDAHREFGLVDSLA